MMKFRELKANEIDVKVAMTTKDKRKKMLLLYKNARVDMQVLDEVVGCLNWKREHYSIDGMLYCTVSIYNEKIGEWVSKSDVGDIDNKQSNPIEKIKSLASSSFKRTCTNWGIGRELYNSPSIWVNVMQSDTNYTKFYVKYIEYSNDGEIIALQIIDDKGNERFKWLDREYKQKRKQVQQAQAKTTAKQATNQKQVQQDKEVEKNLNNDIIKALELKIPQGYLKGVTLKSFVGDAGKMQELTQVVTELNIKALTDAYNLIFNNYKEIVKYLKK